MEAVKVFTTEARIPDLFGSCTGILEKSWSGDYKLYVGGSVESGELSWADRLIYFNNPWLGYIVSNEVKLNPRGGVVGR